MRRTQEVMISCGHSKSERGPQRWKLTWTTSSNERWQCWFLLFIYLTYSNDRESYSSDRCRYPVVYSLSVLPLTVVRSLQEFYHEPDNLLAAVLFAIYSLKGFANAVLFIAGKARKPHVSDTTLQSSDHYIRLMLQNKPYC
jgi:hypothetical protein